MAAPCFIFMFYYSLISLSCLLEYFCSTAADRYELNLNESITNGESLVSANQRFELGFFKPSSTNNRSYLGIWYKKFPHIVAWVANRENPLTDSPGTLTIGRDGKLIILNSTNSIIWSSNSSSTASRNYSVVAQLLDSGNLVLKQNGTTSSEAESHLWQSFDYPGDTLLPGMKIGWDWITGQPRKLTSWKDSNDPSPGDFSYGMDLLGLPQLVVRQGSEKKFRTGVWNGIRFNGIYKSIPTHPVFNYVYANNSGEIYYYYEFTNNPVITRLTLNQSGILQRYAINVGSSDWSLVYVGQSDICDQYKACGANGICKININPSCECLQGFVPKSEREWNVFDRSNGCVRRRPLDCKRDGFLKIKNAKLPDLLANKFGLNKSMNLKECERECLKNCSCTAYANSDVSGRGSGCLIWIGDLIDVNELSDPKNTEQNFYIRLTASELEHNTKKKTVVMLAIISAVSGTFFLIFLIWCRIQKLKRRRERNKEDIDLPLFDLATITSATNNFSSTNMIGTGGFGSVYKGKLSTGQEIAVKRLSKDSGQGAQEFKNEIILISKLQHKNLVRIVGCCFEGKEKLLVYEYMPNESLDYFIFERKRTILKWQNRFEIALGIAKGLAYLHHDSRLRIIHRDLKASNILLDNELNPKISDFGIARIFGGDQNEAKTNIVIGTYGYMSPEYVIDGKFSAKSDVFSYGVLLLEIVSGLRNAKFSNPEHYHSLSGHAWVLWKEGKALEIMDECLENSYVESQVERCIQIGLLCVQRLPKERPTMSLVVSMLGNEDLALAEPKQPGFFIEKYLAQSEATMRECTGGNQLTMTIPEPR